MEGTQEMFGNIDKMFGEGMNFMNNPEGAPGQDMPEMNEDMLDKYADLLLNQMIDKDIIYEPLVDAKKQMEEFLKKEKIEVNSFSKTKNNPTIEDNVKENKSLLYSMQFLTYRRHAKIMLVLRPRSLSVL